jgi:hypothetical protein
MRQSNCAEKHINHGGLQVSAVRYYFSGELSVSQPASTIRSSLICWQQTSNGMTTASMTPRMPKDGREIHVENYGNQHAQEQL